MSGIKRIKTPIKMIYIFNWNFVGLKIDDDNQEMSPQADRWKQRKCALALHLVCHCYLIFALHLMYPGL
jgi:hypothetical protein